MRVPLTGVGVVAPVCRPGKRSLKSPFARAQWTGNGQAVSPTSLDNPCYAIQSIGVVLGAHNAPNSDCSYFE